LQFSPQASSPETFGYSIVKFCTHPLLRVGMHDVAVRDGALFFFYKTMSVRPQNSVTAVSSQVLVYFLN